MEKEGASAETYLGPDFCVRVVDDDMVNYNYYLISSKTTRKYLVDRLPLKSLPEDLLSSVASSGSMVYVTGGLRIRPGEEDLPVTDVYCMDPYCPEEGWKVLPPMNYGRADHGSFFYHEKLFVWGGATSKGATEAEVYDTKLMKWDCLDDLPLEVDLHGMESTWPNFISHLFGSETYASAFVGGTVYSLRRKLGGGQLCAYDPVTCYGPMPVISSMGENLSHFLPYHDFEMSHEVIPQHCLLSLGNDILGVVYLEVGIQNFLNPHVKLKRLHISKFRMKRIGPEGVVIAKLVDHSSHYILGFDISKCVALDPLLPRDKAMIECSTSS